MCDQNKNNDSLRKYIMSAFYAKKEFKYFKFKITVNLLITQYII